MTAPFPRKNDGLPHAWGLKGKYPHEIWERFSPDYEKQAEVMWQVFAEMGLLPALEWAGSQDGEAIIGRDEAGEIVVLYHLENPQDAQAVQRAIADGAVQEFVTQSIRAAREETAHYAALDAQRTDEG